MSKHIENLAEQQRNFWNSAEGEKWVTNQSVLDAMFVPLTDVLLEYAKVQRNESILDVGCGAGTTTSILADRAGPGARILGVDISAALLAAARAQMNAAQVRFFEGDAGSDPIPLEEVDLLFSRFGVMFFADPVQAFVHMRSVMKPSGRLCFVCWDTREHNPWFEWPYEVITARLGPQEPAPARAPGPMAFAQTEYIEEIIDAAGFYNLEIETRNVVLDCSTGAEDTARFLMEFGPGARMLANYDVDDKTMQLLVNDVSGRLNSCDEKTGVQMPARLHYVCASCSQ